MLLYSLLHLTGYALPLEELKRFRQLGSRTRAIRTRHRARRRTRAAGARARQRGGHGPRRASRRAFNRQARHRRSLHLRLPRRRLHDGRHLPRGLLARRHARPGQTHCRLRRQRHLDRFRQGRDPPVVHRRRAPALRRLRLARRRPGRRPRRGGRRRRSSGQAREGPPDAHHREDHDRQGRPKKANTGAAHGAPLGAEEIAATRVAIGWPHAPFVVPEPSTPAGTRARPARKPSAAGTGFSRATRSAFPRQPSSSAAWPEVSGRLRRPRTGAHSEFNGGLELATRKASQNVLDTLVAALPELVGGSADLTGSNLTWAKGSRRCCAALRPATTSFMAYASSACAR